jgi:hypothetical protein
MSRYSFSSWLQDALLSHKTREQHQVSLGLCNGELVIHSASSSALLQHQLSMQKVLAQRLVELTLSEAALQSECQALRFQLQEYQRND